MTIDDWLTGTMIRRLLRPAAPLVAVLVLLGGCGKATAPPNPDAASVSWQTYSDPRIGYSFEHPDVFQVSHDRDENGVILRYDGYPVVSIGHFSEEEADDRGLWAGRKPQEQIRLGGRPGVRYVYDHPELLASMRTVSYVVEHKRKFLGLEFRTELDQPDAVQQRMLDSFRFD